jgi:hypothetical protein
MDHKCYLSKIEPLHGDCVGSTIPEAADPILRIMLLTSLSMVIASTQTRHRSAYIPDHGGDGWPLLLNWRTGVRRGCRAQSRRRSSKS